MKLRVATCAALPEVDTDAGPLATALASADFDATLVAWDDPAADWTGPTATVIRSTWNYALDVSGYEAWIARVAATAPLFNPPAVIRDNLRKRYLLALERAGLPIVPTTVVERGSVIAIEATAAAGARRFVIKPEIGAGSLGAKVFEAGAIGAASEHLAALTAHGAALVQPYLESVEAYGERSLVWIDGELSHAIRKSPRFAGDVESVTGPVPIADDERVIAESAIRPYGALLYGRIDLARDADGTPRIMELELVEPSLFFAKAPAAADRFAAGLRARIQALA